jgi:DnaJ-class molecular chaperone
MAKDPYKLLGVPRTASDAEIRKAYRALAKKYHPDVNKDKPHMAEKFKEISAAYSLLSDKDMKKRYDSGQVDGSGQQQNPFAGGFGGGRNPFGTGFGGMGGMGGGRRGSMGGGDDMAELFSSLFGMNMGGMQGGMNRQRRSPPQKGADIRYKITLPFVDAITGGTKKLTGGLTVKIPKGVEDGQVLRLAGKGKAGVNGGPQGDAKVEIAIKPHKNFTRDGTKLRLTLPISLKEAVLGGTVSVPLPGGDVGLKIPAGANTGQKMRLKGKGIKGGDLIVTLQIILAEGDSSALQDWANSSPDTSFDPRKGLL